MLRFCSDFVFLPAVFCTCTCGCTPELLVLNSLLETVFLSNSSCILVQSIKISKKLMAAAMVQTEPLQGSKTRKGQRGLCRGGRAPRLPADHVLRMPWPGPCADTFPAKGEPGDWQSTVQAAADIGPAPTSATFCFFYFLSSDLLLCCQPNLGDCPAPPGALGL